MKTTEILIHINDLSFSYGDMPLFSHLSFDVWSGDICLITGPSWVGKSTLLSLIGGITPVKIGSIKFDDVLLPREQGFGYSFIEWPFFENLSVRDNIFLLEHFADVTIDRAYYMELLRYFELDMIESQSLISLSAWQRERVNIVRSLVHKPRVVLLDEPGINLDARLFDKLIARIKYEKKKDKRAFVIVSHDRRCISLATNQILLISH